MSSQVGVFLSQQMIDEIVRIGLDAAPSEACGVLLPTPKVADWGETAKVVPLPNRSLDHIHNYAIQPGDIKLAIAEWAARSTAEERNALAVWHTHPRGEVGPSRTDMQTRLPGIAYLVVAIDPDTRSGIPTWF